jgi:THO complex subunit 7
MANLVTAEDDVIKKRLLIEGDSGNDDRLINKLCRNFVKWANNSTLAEQQENTPDGGGGGGGEESAEFMHEQIMACLAHVEFGLLRNQFILDMNFNEQHSYEVLYEKINDEIEKAKGKIVANKADLQEARKIRKNRQEYDILARQILNYPDRGEMEATIASLETKLEGLKRTEHELDRKLELRRKQFNAVLHSLSSMKNVIENDTKLDEYLAGRGDELPDSVAKSAGSFHDSLLDAKMSRLLSDENSEVDKTDKNGRHRGDLDDIDQENVNNVSSRSKRGEDYAGNSEIEMEDS